MLKIVSIDFNYPKSAMFIVFSIFVYFSINSRWERIYTKLVCDSRYSKEHKLYSKERTVIVREIYKISIKGRKEKLGIDLVLNPSR